MEPGQALTQVRVRCAGGVLQCAVRAQVRRVCGRCGLMGGLRQQSIPRPRARHMSLGAMMGEPGRPRCCTNP